MSTIVGNNSDGRNLAGSDFGNGIIYAECLMRQCDLRGADISCATLVKCDLSGTHLRGLKVRLDCSQGVGNKIDGFQTAALLYWFLHVTDPPIEWRERIETLVSPYKSKLEKYFSSEG